MTVVFDFISDMKVKFIINTQIMIMIYLLEDDDDKLIALSYSFIKV